MPTSEFDSDFISRCNDYIILRATNI
jgi:hypothetical protein